MRFSRVLLASKLGICRKSLVHETDRIVSLLASDALEKRVAAAIVLGELGVRSNQVTDGLAQTLDSGIPLLQRHALEALAKTGAKRALSRIFPLLASPSDEVRKAARAAVASVGEEVLGALKERLGAASGDERHALDALLADVGGMDTFTGLVKGLASATGEAAQAAAHAVGQRVRHADARTRRTYLAETEKFLASQAKARGQSAAIAAAIKVLGYLEDPRTVPTLLSYATSKTADALVRTEAILAFRSALRGDAAPPKVVDALAAAAESEDRTLAQTALHTLGSLALAPQATLRLARLLTSPDPERVKFVIELLGRLGSVEAARLLVHVLARLDRRYAEPAKAALAGKEDAAPALARALIETDDGERLWTLHTLLRPIAKKVPPALRRELLSHATERLAAGTMGWEAALDIVRDTDPEAVAEALRALAQRMLRTKNLSMARTVLGLLLRSEGATSEDRYLLASLTLLGSALDTRPSARGADDALRILDDLASRGFDVARALKRDRSLELEHLYYVGYHFIEGEKPMGRELLEEVRSRGGRGKVGRMARSKLEISTA